MLTHLQIRDFAIVDSVELEFGPGLTVLTGETGAGKSIVVDALTVASGARAGADQIRAGAERAEVCATFDLRKAPRALRDRLDEQAIEADDELIVRRVLTADGRSRAYLNGQTVTLQLLREVVGELVDIHGQHEFQSLVRPVAQRELLDSYGRLDPLVGQVQAAHRVWFALLDRLLQLESQARDRDARLELLRYQDGELAALDLKPGEFAALGAESQRLANSGRLLESTQAAAQALYEGDGGSAHASIAQAIALLRPLQHVDAALAPLLPLLEEASIRVSEAARELSRYADALDLDSSRQAEVERRLAAIEDLARKHRSAPAELTERREVLRSELAALEHIDHNVATLRRQQTDALAQYRELATQLSTQRSAAALAFSRDISQRMQALGMRGGEFQVDVQPHQATEPQAHGLDQIEFRVTANPGQPLRSLAKVASGGELARLSLAVQVACTAGDLRCMVFDEVDSGIGGAVAEIIGRELRALGERAQVLCVTHLAQVASQGHHHLRVLKLSDGRSTRTQITPLSGDDRVQEIARMLGGVQVTARAQDHAREMLDAAVTVPVLAAPRPRAKRAKPPA
jgi:DNA repair protein RecN (Recombination protein N)